MRDVQKGRRQGEDDALFRKPPIKDGVIPDRVSPAVEGYFHIPALWIGDAPDPKLVENLNREIHHQTVINRKMYCGIEIRVRRDGLFLFDFSDWSIAPIMVIPGFVVAEPNKSYIATKEHQIAENQAEDIAVLRAKVMNVHQGCLSTAHYMLKNTSIIPGFQVNAWNTVKSLSIFHDPEYYDDTEDMHALSRNVLNNSYKVKRDRHLPRQAIGIEIVDASIHILDSILSHQDPKLINLVEAAYMSACLSREKRYGESVAVGFTVCEQILSLAWIKLIDSMRTHSDKSERMPMDRRKKLSGGRDYSASVIIESLEMHGIIDYKLYTVLDKSRKARNAWAHEMVSPSEADIYACQSSIEMLLKQILNINWKIPAGGRGGVPQWPIWMWEERKKKRRLLDQKE